MLELPTRILRLSGLLAALALLSPASAFAQNGALDDLLMRTGKQMSSFVDQFSEVKCTERVTQEKLNKNDKVERKAESTFDYLVILTNTSGDLSLDESRLEVQAAKAQKKQSVPLLVSNGFATLFLIFHPYYSPSFTFSADGEDVIDGRHLLKVHFAHIRNTRSIAALAVRGREYPLEFAGTAWIDPQTAQLARIVAGVDTGVEDIGMKALRSEVDFATVRFGGVESPYWFPSQAVVEVETPRQHWRNTHRFSDYKRFSVSTEEQVAKQ